MRAYFVRLTANNRGIHSVTFQLLPFISPLYVRVSYFSRVHSHVPWTPCLLSLRQLCFCSLAILELFPVARARRIVKKRTCTRKRVEWRFVSRMNSFGARVCLLMAGPVSVSVHPFVVASDLKLGGLFGARLWLNLCWLTPSDAALRSFFIDKARLMRKEQKNALSVCCHYSSVVTHCTVRLLDLKAFLVDIFMSWPVCLVERLRHCIALSVSIRLKSRRA